MKTIDLKTLSTVTGAGKTVCKGVINSCGNKTDESTTNTQKGGKGSTNIQAPITAAPKITLPFPGAPE